MDIRAAYNSVDRDTIWSKLQNNLTSALFYMVRHMFDDIRIAVILQNSRSRHIYPKKKQGVLQGSILSPLIYAVFIDSLPKMLRINMITRCHNPLKLRSTLQAGTIKHLLKNGAIKVVLMAVQITIVLISTQQLYHPYYMQMMWFS